jgi:hypothetical protein
VVLESAQAFLCFLPRPFDIVAASLCSFVFFPSPKASYPICPLDRRFSVNDFSSVKTKLNSLLAVATVCLAFVQPVFAQEKIPVKSADDLPRISYEAGALPSVMISDLAAVGELAAKLKADLLSILETYDIQDKATLKGYLSDLRNIATLEGQYAKAADYNLEIRALQDKPADRLTSGLSTEVMLELLESGQSIGSQAFLEAFKRDYAAKVQPLPWEVVQDNIESAKGGMEMYSENLVLGLMQAQMDPGVEESGQLDFNSAAAVVRFRYLIDFVLPLKEATVEVLADYIAANRVEKADIWHERSVDLTGLPNLHEVVVAIWDSGTDVEIFQPKGQVWTNAKEIPGDGLDNDNNGWVDDIHGFAHDLHGKKTQGVLFDLPDEVTARYDELTRMSKGLSDVQASVDSEEATAFKQYMSSLQPAQVQSFLLDLGYFGNYSHGTHVAGIAAEGNPAIRLLTARITFDHKVIPDVPTLEETVRGIRAGEEAVRYMKEQGVRVVNMSWGGTQAGIEGAFEANGVGDDAEMRARMARILYELSYDGLVEVMASAPEILFIPAAGNSDEDIDFNKVIPSSISLSNVLVAGAVDQAGDETGFTSYGENVRIHANGFEVDSYIPGGKRQKFSGTSMSAPNVTNLAAKLLAIDPSLTPEQVISLILLGAETTEDGRRHLIHPQRSIQMLYTRNGLELPSR